MSVAGPPVVAESIRRLGDRVLVDAEAPRSVGAHQDGGSEDAPAPGRPASYPDVLLASDVVVSTARHEFFGVAPVEAMAAGCVPLLPDRLSYPELVPSAFHGAVLYRRRLFDRLRAVLEDLDGARRRVTGLRPAMLAHDAETVTPRWDDWFESVAAGSCDVGGPD